MVHFPIPGGSVRISHLVLDFNGTIAKDGQLFEDLPTLIAAAANLVTIHVITADTHGSAKAQLFECCTLRILNSNDHSAEKAEYVHSLGAPEVMAAGNGRNDVEMLKAAAIGIAVIQDEMASAATILAADMVTTDIRRVFELFDHPARAVATLRR